MDPHYFFVDVDRGPTVLLNADPVPAAFLMLILIRIAQKLR